MTDIPTTTNEAAAAKVTCVKWANPAEELLGTATLAGGLVRDKGMRPEHLCIAVPNHNWAAQMRRAGLQVGLPVTVCMKPVRLSADAQAVCAKLAALAEPDTDKARGLWASLGFSREEAQRLMDDYGAARAFTLVRMLGMRDIQDFANALHHVRGGEHAAELYQLVKAQIACPTVPESMGLAPIVDYRAVSGSFDWLFVVGCVDGLIPGPAAFEASTQHERTQALDADRMAFNALSSAARQRVVLSCFTRLDATLAQQAHVRASRYKMEAGKRLAMTTPTLFLNEAGNNRPSTVGGQALLREYNLN